MNYSLNGQHTLLKIGVLIAALVWLSGTAASGGGQCGNVVLEIGEQCDDGNQNEGDGCSSACQIESGYECTAPYIPLGSTNTVKDPGFEDGLGTSFWEDISDAQLPNICNLNDCPLGSGPRYGAHWAQLGAFSDNLFWKIRQEVEIPPGFKYLRFDVLNAQCSEPQTPDDFFVTLNEEVVWSSNSSDPECMNPNGSYRSVTINLDTAPGGPWDTGQTVELAMMAQTVSGESIRSFDNFHVAEQGDDLIASVCTLKNNVEYFQPFENVDAPLGAPGFFQNTLGELPLLWGTTEDGICGAGQSPPGNHTGEPGAAACIDSTTFQRQVGLVETYVCADPVDLSFLTGNQLFFVVNYQPGSQSSDDFFGIWVDTQPFLGPLADGAASAVFLVNNPLGEFGQPPGVSGNVDISFVDGKPEVYICFGYGNDGQGYAQVDTVILGSQGCTDDFEEDKLESCVDNCIDVSNPMQRDTDNDGYGNACDADIARDLSEMNPETANGNDCITNFQDFFVFTNAMFSGPLDINWNPDADMDGNNVVNFGDLAMFASLFLRAPGPSGQVSTCGVSGGT